MQDNQVVSCHQRASTDCTETLAAENSQRCLGASDKYRLLVVLVQKADDQPVTYTMTNKFQVGWTEHTPALP